MQTHHISLLAKDAKQNINFYTKVLGMRLIKNTVNQENIKIRHLFYGDYLGTPGTVVTFFVLPLLGSRTDAKHFFNGIKLAIPKNATPFWEKRMSELSIATRIVDKKLTFLDPDGVLISLVENDEMLKEWHIVPDNQIPSQYQITRLLGTELHVPEPDKTAKFFRDFLGVSVSTNNVVKLENKQSIELYQSDVTKGRTRFGRGSIDHFAFAVSDQKELVAYYQKAKATNQNIEEYVDRGWFKSLYVRDPGDNRIELATSGPGFSLDEPILTMGQNLGLPPMFENRRLEILDYYGQSGIDFHDTKQKSQNHSAEWF